MRVSLAAKLDLYIKVWLQNWFHSAAPFIHSQLLTIHFCYSQHSSLLHTLFLLHQTLHIILSSHYWLSSQPHSSHVRSLYPFHQFFLLKFSTCPNPSGSASTDAPSLHKSSACIIPSSSCNTHPFYAPLLRIISKLLWTCPRPYFENRSRTRLRSQISWRVIIQQRGRWIFLMCRVI